MADNLLAHETSPYLLQHKDNPVHWMPWGDEAFARASAENKPILLSVGYAACHWCHVMAHESFEDPGTADLMNEHFISVKVDREERPDVDRIYMDALHRLGEQGGWPLTMFLTPEGDPFWGGTYFPKETLYGRPSFRHVLTEIARIYHEEHDKVRHNTQALRDAIANPVTPEAPAPLAMPIVAEAARHALRLVDRDNGGIQGAPKFPQTPLFSLLWRNWLRTREPDYREAVETTLFNICQGGIYDHLGGGFSRYAVDNAWLVPHFEKMLYDNAQLLELMTLVWQDTGDPLLRLRIEETVDWVSREMIAESGAFAASLDADSEGEEGRYYVWTRDEIEALLEPDLAELFCRVYGVTPEGNWEGKAILNRLGSLSLADPETEHRLAEARDILLAHRNKRVRPGWDDKVLADWNGLMIAALANAGAAFARPDWIELAVRAFDAIRRHLWTQDGLNHGLRLGQARHPATADDFAHLIRAAIVLHEITTEQAYLDDAERLADMLDRDYWDTEKGGYFFTSARTEHLITRLRTAQDDATPNGNAAMLANLARLHALTGKIAYRDRTQALIDAFTGEVLANVFAHASFLNAFEDAAELVQAVTVGPPDAPETRALRQAVLAQSIPARLLMSIADTSHLPDGHPAAGKPMKDAKPTLYLCRGQHCSLPITDPASLADAFRIVSE